MSYEITYFEYNSGNDFARPTPKNLHHLRSENQLPIYARNINEAKTTFNRFFPKRRIVKAYYINKKPVANEYEGTYILPLFGKTSENYYIVIVYAYTSIDVEQYEKLDRVMNPTLYTKSIQGYTTSIRGGKKITRKYRKNKKSKRRRSYKRTYKK